MKDALAELLLATVMDWNSADVANDRPYLQTMAQYKYDEYQQFAPGTKFVESLALWLQQFKTTKERNIAYKFVKSRLVFFSSAEISHLVSMAYPDLIRSQMISKTASILGVPDCLIAKIVSTSQYKILKRQCLFLGMSDGAHMGVFRRSTNSDLSNEQIWQAYEMPQGKSKNLLKKMREDVAKLAGKDEKAINQQFRMIFLLDDFSGSGRSCVRYSKNGKEIEGKVCRVFNDIVSGNLSTLFDVQDLYIGIVLYVATNQAIEHIESVLKELFKGYDGIEWDVHVINRIDERVKLSDKSDQEFLQLVETYYDKSVEDEHTSVGGVDVRRGFAGCSLPLVLNHNTPNNSVFLLWANPDRLTVRGLFPRISRHRRNS